MMTPAARARPTLFMSCRSDAPAPVNTCDEASFPVLMSVVHFAGESSSSLCHCGGLGHVNPPVTVCRVRHSDAYIMQNVLQMHSCDAELHFEFVCSKSLRRMTTTGLVRF